MGLLKKRRCRNCRRLFAPNPRNIDSQKYCFRSECRKASKRCSQKKWLNKPENRNYFRGPAHVERVQEWRKKNPGYWKKTKSPDTLQDSILPQPAENKQDSTQFMDNALQDFLRTQPPVIIGLIANFTGSALQDDIASTLLRMKKYGQDILCSQPQKEGEQNDYKGPHFTIQDSQNTPKLQLDRSSPGA